MQRSNVKDHKVTPKNTDINSVYNKTSQKTITVTEKF